MDSCGAGICFLELLSRAVLTIVLDLHLDVAFSISVSALRPLSRSSSTIVFGSIFFAVAPIIRTYM